jgi:hypothetical protein
MRYTRIMIPLLVVVLAACLPAEPVRTPTPDMALTADASERTSNLLRQWGVIDLRDPAITDLVLPDDEGYRVDSQWQVDRIEYVYKWWGLGKPLFDHQLIQWREGAYYSGTLPIALARVAALVNALDHLRPAQTLMEGKSHYDDYPSWVVEVTGKDGRTLLLSSSSTGNPHSGPWNVLVNGRLFVQYEGQMAVPLEGLFTTVRGQPAAAYSPGRREPGTISFASGGLPAQLSNGFRGLLPIADGFGYWTNAFSGTLDGYILGRESIGGFGSMVIGTITTLVRVEAQIGNTARSCEISNIPTRDPAGAGWTFHCLVGQLPRNEWFHFPITAELADDNDRRVVTVGELYGQWGVNADAVYLPPEPELQAVFAAHPAGRSLLKDHVLIRADYLAQVTMTGSLRHGRAAGEAILMGVTDVTGKRLRYTVASPFGLQDGKLVTWSLTTTALQQMLADVTRLPLVRRLHGIDADLVLNLWYSENEWVSRDEFGLVSAALPHYDASISDCDGRQPDGTFPTPGKPLRGFSFNNAWKQTGMEFVLVGNVAVVGQLELALGSIKPDRVRMALMPQNMLPLYRLPVRYFDFSGGRIALYTDMDTATESEKKVIRGAASKLPVQFDVGDDREWIARNVAILLTDDGQLAVTACN